MISESSLHISTVMPVYNGLKTLGRAIRSVANQSYQNWELIVVDDMSTDGSYEVLTSLAGGRIRALRSTENLGPSAARNLGLGAARGDFITYLDCDDEYYVNYFENISKFHMKGDVLVFEYDCVQDNGVSRVDLGPHQPAPFRDFLFMKNLVTPLGIAHHRRFWDMVGGFDETLWCMEDWDYWKRLARAGAEFIFLPLLSGIYHVRDGSRSRAPRLTDQQRALVEQLRITRKSI